MPDETSGDPILVAGPHSRRLVDLSFDLLTVLDERFRFLSLNGAWPRVLGWSREDLAEHPFSILLPADELALWNSIQGCLKSQPDPVPFQARARSRDGSYRHISWIARSETGSFYLAGSDVTELRHCREQLMQAQKMEAVGQLTGGLAHDFGNILGTISGMTEIMREQLQSMDPIRGDLETVLDATNRAQGLVHRLLTFARRQPVYPRFVDLNAAVQDIQKLVRPLLGHQIALEFDPSPGRTIVAIDPVQLDQIILNLASNARDAMPDGGRLRLEIQSTVLDDAYVATHPGARAGDYVTLLVEDSGTGMPPETQARIFEPFFTTKTPDQGTGLGLAIVYGAVKQVGGYVWVQSTPGVGTRFTLHFPRA